MAPKALPATIIGQGDTKTKRMGSMIDAIKVPRTMRVSLSITKPSHDVKLVDDLDHLHLIILIYDWRPSDHNE